MSEELEQQNDSDDEELTFEDALNKLEELVRTLEQGELTLNKSLTIFEEGMKLAKFCNKKLEQAEQKIEILLKKNGELKAEKFEIAEE
jgi:exodeoxyribonuclease VII small subunit